MGHDVIEALTTPRLALTRIAERDWPELRAMHNDPRVMATLGGVQPPAVTRAAFDRLLRHWDDHGFGWWAVRDHAARFLGRGGLRRVLVESTEELEIGYGIIADAWGRGYATELARAAAAAGFERIGAGSLCSFTLPSNAASRRVMDKVGLEFEREVVYAELSHVLYRIGAARWHELERARAALADAAPPRLIVVVDSGADRTTRPPNDATPTS